MGGLIDRLKHAFDVRPDADAGEKPLPEALDRLAAAVVDRGMETPAIVLIDSIRPVSFLAGQTLHAVWPLVRIAGDFKDYEAVAGALEDRQMLERLALRIERLAEERRKEAKAR